MAQLPARPPKPRGAARSETARLSDEQLETLFEVVFMVCFADGVFGPEEQARFRARVAQLEDGHLRSDRVDGLMLQAAMRIEAEGREPRLRRARAILADAEARRIALALAVDVARADGLDDDERASARAVAMGLGVDVAELEALLA